MTLPGKLHRVFSELSFQAGVLPSFAGKAGHFILCYHGVTPGNETRFNSRHEPLKCFEKHVHYLKKNFHVIPLRDFFERKFLSGKINVAITLDDGYRNNFLYAKPVFEKYEVPATIFVTGLNNTDRKILWGDFVNIFSYFHQEPVEIEGEKFINEGEDYVSTATGKTLYEIIKKEKTHFEYKEKVFSAFSPAHKLLLDESLTDYWQLMSDEEIKSCSQSDLIEIGSHGFYHNNLGGVPLADAASELTQSKNYLETLLQKAVASVAYPDSSYSREVIDEAERIGLRHQLAANGFLFGEDKNDNRIRDRIGIYNCGRCGNQLLQAIQ